MAGKTRNSSIELLRILCIFGIIFMHTIAYGGDELAGFNRRLLIFANCFTNLGVTCFMLISGYFGVSFQPEKLIRLDLMVIFYSVLHVLIRFATGAAVGGMDLVSMVFPILSNQYWYLTAYFIIAILSGFLNRVAEQLGRKQFQQMLAFFLFLFWVVPTFLHFDILATEGKNVVQMTVIYLIGRYIRRYDVKAYRTGRLAVVLLCNILITFVLEMILFTLTGHYSMFYRDCSIFTVVSAILLFLLFKNVYFENTFINKIATAVLAVYVFSFGFQRLVYLLLPLERYAFSPLFFPLVFVFAVCVVTGCIAIDLVRQRLFGKAERTLSTRLVRLCGELLGKAEVLLQRIVENVLNYIQK